MTDLLRLAPTWTALQTISICDERPAAMSVLSRILIEAMSAVTAVASSADSEELLAQYAAHPSDLVFVGIRAGRVRGVQAAAELLLHFPGASVIVYGSVLDVVPLSAAVGQGARGFLIWDANNPILTPARQSSSRLALGQQQHGAERIVVRLTDRELQILGGMSNGLSNGEIGRSLFLSEDTVKTHARSMFHKLGAHDRAHAVALGLRNDLVA